TNGLLLPVRYPDIRDHVSVYSLAIDGPNAETAEWFRGRGYFDRFTANVDLLVTDGRRLAFNTFTTRRSAAHLPRLAGLIATVAARVTVEYWLVSQYRPIGRASAVKNDLYAYPPADFTRAVDAVRPWVHGIPVYAQPTR